MTNDNKKDNKDNDNAYVHNCHQIVATVMAYLHFKIVFMTVSRQVQVYSDSLKSFARKCAKKLN